MHGHQRFEEPAVIGHAQVQQLVRDDKVLESRFPIDQIDGEGHDSRRGARSPRPRHALNANPPRAQMTFRNAA